MRSGISLNAPISHSTKTYNFAAIDYVRLVMAFLVILCHCKALSCFGEPVYYYTQELFGRLAVPFFFFCTGYFSLAHISSQSDLQHVLPAQIRKLICVYLFWTLFYIPLAIYEYTYDYKLTPLQICEKFVHEFFFTGSYFHLWYLNASAFALFLLYCCFRKRLSWRMILFAAAILYCAGLSFSSWYRIVRLLPFWDVPVIYYPTKAFLKIIIRPSNGLFLGFPFVALGAYFSRHSIPPFKICLFGFILSMSVALPEVWYIRHLGLGGPFPDSSLYCFLPFAATFLFCGLLQMPIGRQSDTKFFRKISGLIYFIHKWFIELCSRYLPFGNSLLQFIAVAFLSVMFSIIILRLSEKRRFSWMKRFY